MTRVPLLAARHLGKQYDRRVAVHDVSLALHAGEVVALLGPNGAGKTTTLRLLAGLLRPTAGDVHIHGVRQTPRSWPAARGALGLLTESPGLWDRLSVETNLLTFALLLGVPNPRRRVAALLDQLGLHDRADDPAGNLSKGMRQKLALGRALVHDPRILLLDEPTAGLDPAMTRSFRDIIGRLRADGRAILVSTHNLDEAARLADRVAVLDGTIVALDTPAVLAARWSTPRVRVTLTPPVAPYAELLLAGGVRDLSVNGGELEGTVDDLTRDVPRIVRTLAAAGADVHAVVPVQTSLEDAYLRITNRGARTSVPMATDDAEAGGAVPAAEPAATAGRSGRVMALLWKEWQDLRRTWAPWLPGLFIIPVLAIPFAFTWLLPTVAGEAVADSDFAEQLDRIRPLWPAVQELTRRAATEAFVFQQYLVLVVLIPVAGAMSIAAHSIIGEKQARSLEPLLATPLTALELLFAKVLAALAPALVLEAVAVTIYAGAIALTADTGVMGVLASWRSAIVVFLLGPFATLLGLQLVVLSSTRARDPRSAQQIGVLVVIPIVGLLIGQSAGAFWLTSPTLLLIAGLLAALWAGLLVLSAATFDVEQVLTRWK